MPCTLMLACTLLVHLFESEGAVLDFNICGCTSAKHYCIDFCLRSAAVALSCCRCDPLGLLPANGAQHSTICFANPPLVNTCLVVSVLTCQHPTFFARGNRVKTYNTRMPEPCGNALVQLHAIGPYLARAGFLEMPPQLSTWIKVRHAL